METYTLGSPKYWENPAFLELPTAGAQNILQYLHAKRNLSGLFELSLTKTYLETRSTAEDFNALAAAGFIVWCAEHSMVWLVDGLARRVVKPIAKHWSRINAHLEHYDNCHLASELCTHNRPAWGDKLKDPCPELENPNQYALEAVLGAPTVRPLKSPALEHQATKVESGFYWRSTDVGVVTYANEMAVMCKQVNFEDAGALDEAFKVILTTKQGAARATEVQERFFRSVARYPAKQVAMAAVTYIDKGVAEQDIRQQDKYFIGMVRGCDKQYQKWAQGEEIRLEQKRKQERIRDAARRNREALRGAGGEGRPTGPQPIGTLLRKL